MAYSRSMVTADEKGACGTEFRWLRTVDESIAAMLAAINAARRSVCLEMYIYTGTAVGERFRDALTEAARRGLQVKVMVDAWGSVTLSDKFWTGLREAGGEVRWFNPLRLGCCGIRDHRKLLVCDEAVAFVGGFNIASEYEGDGVTRGWFDLGLQVEGYLARELAASFDPLFALADFRHRRFARFRKRVDQRIVATAQGQVILAGPGHRPHLLKAILLKDIKSAKSLKIIAAYFLPSRPIRRALVRAARHGTHVQIILGAKSDVPLLQVAFRRFYQSFLRAGIEVYEYEPQILHAKLIIADHTVYAGSANLDRRSFLANYELMLRITHLETAAQAREIFAGTLTHCRRVERRSWRRSRSFWDRLKERWAFFLLARVDACLSRRQLRNLR
jgi:cardiolipin synthase A/B